MLTIEDIKKALNSMFGFMFTQPIYKTLKVMSIMPVMLLISSQVMLFQILHEIKVLDDAVAKVGALVTIGTTLIVQMYTAFNNLNKSMNKDE